MDNLDNIRKLLTPEKQDLLTTWVDAYTDYSNGAQSMPDAVFDEVTRELQACGIEQVVTFINNSLEELDGDGKLEINDNPDMNSRLMLSLEKIKFQDMTPREVATSILKWVGTGKKYYIGPKFDGCAIGKRDMKVLTRGGLDLTSVIGSLIDKLPGDVSTGELVVKKSIFRDNLSKFDGTGEYENTRNFVGSVVKSHSVFRNYSQYCDIVGLTDGKNPLLDSTYIDNDGTRVKTWNELNLEDLTRLDKIHDGYLATCPYDIDGIVISVFEDGPRKVKDKYPLNMIAVKFSGETIETTIKKLNWDHTKTGKLTPVADIEPVYYNGATLERANCYSLDYVRRMGIGEGSRVLVTRSGEIIPAVVKVLTRSTTIHLDMKGKVIIGAHVFDESVMNASNTPEKFTLALKLLQLDGIGPVSSYMIGNVVNNDVINLFDISLKPRIREVLGNDKWYKFQDFYNIKTLSLDQVINLLQFNGVAVTTSRKLALLLSTKDKKHEEGIPVDTIKRVLTGDGFSRVQDAVRRLASHGIKVTNPVEVNDTTVTFEMSGDWEVMTKEEFKTRLKHVLPNAVHTTLTRTTTYLFVDRLTSTTGKANKARKYNVKMVTYEDALKGKF
jgi:NAD-dependent DNA ligase